MLDGMTVKIAVSLPDELVDHARRMVAVGRATSVSGAVAVALARDAQQETFAEFAGEMLTESGGPLTEQERAAARRALGLG